MMYLTRSKTGKLLLCQQKPSWWTGKRRAGQKRKRMTNMWNGGQVFTLEHEIPGSESIPNAAYDGTMYGVVVELFYIPKGSTPETLEEQWPNPLWVTRERNGYMMLHHKEEPTRMRDSEKWKYSREHLSHKEEHGHVFDLSIKKDGRKWTSWKSHFRFSAEFGGSTNITFDDEFPAKVGLRIPKEYPMPFNTWMKNYNGLHTRPFVENKKRVLLKGKLKD